VKPELETLIRLQRAEIELHRLEAELEEVPRRTAALDEHLGEDRGRLDAARGDLETSQKNRRRHEAELQDLEVKRSRYKSQLMEVKTNREYTAMLHEIEGVERQIHEREDQILEEMEAADGLVLLVKRQEGVFKAAEEHYRSEVAELKSARKQLEEAVAHSRSERGTLAAALPEELGDLFQRVVRLRGTGVAEARDGMCQACHVVLRPQMYVDIKRTDVIHQCPSCSRILYFEPPAPVEVPPGL